MTQNVHVEGAQVITMAIWTKNVITQPSFKKFSISLASNKREGIAK